MADTTTLVRVSGSTEPFITKPFIQAGTTSTPVNLTTWVGTLHYRKDGVASPVQTITGAQVVGDAAGVVTVTPNPDEIIDEGYYTGRILMDDLAVSPTERLPSEEFRFRVDPIVTVQ